MIFERRSGGSPHYIQNLATLASVGR
jgi:hypothetical protein